MKRVHAPASEIRPSTPPPEYDPSRHAAWSGRRDAPPGDALLAGYRVVRRLASGSRADVYLGHSSTPGVDPVALKVFRPETDTESIEREIHTLCDARGAQFVQLIDVATLPDSRVCLVLERLDPRPLGRFLGDRATISPGEAVTLLAPIVATLADLHEHGLSHAGLGLGTILLRSSGRPVLTGLGSLRELPDPSTAGIGFLREDYGRVAMLLQEVFAHVDRSSGGDCLRGAQRLVDEFRACAGSTPFRPRLGELERSLFEWNSAAPVRLHPAAPIGEERTPLHQGATPLAVDGAGRHRLHAVALSPGGPDGVDAAWAWEDLERGPNGPGVTATGVTATGTARGGRVRRSVVSIGRRGAWLLQLTDERTAAAVRRRLGTLMRARRRPLLTAGLVAASAVVVALTLLPPGGEASRGQDVDARAVPPTPTVTAAGAGAGAGASNAIDEDPVLAVPELLARRTACRESASVVCLDGVDQSGSAAMAADTRDVLQVHAGEAVVVEPAYESWSATLVERTGNSALVSLAPPDAALNSQPASVLVVKGEAGWRLRQIFSF